MSPRVVASMFDVLYRQKEFLLVHRFLIRITFLFRASDILKYLTTFGWFPTPLTNCSGQTGIKKYLWRSSAGPRGGVDCAGPWTMARPPPPPPKTATAYLPQPPAPSLPTAYRSLQLYNPPCICILSLVAKPLYLSVSLFLKCWSDDLIMEIAKNGQMICEIKRAFEISNQFYNSFNG